MEAALVRDFLGVAHAANGIDQWLNGPDRT
jgi:hypothetical protein